VADTSHQTKPSAAAQKLAATIMKRIQVTLNSMGINAAVSETALPELIDLYLMAARNEGRRAAARQLADLEATFDLRWQADMRAIALWRAEAPGRELKQPDHADMVIWLLSKLESVGVQICRDDKDYAIEFGRYLANAAEIFLATINKAERIALHDQTGEPATLAEVARHWSLVDTDEIDVVRDHWRALESAIYEFRKRAARAK
jgi:hypothetical protein